MNPEIINALIDALTKLAQFEIDATADYMKFEHRVVETFRSAGLTAEQLRATTQGILVDVGEWGHSIGLGRQEALRLHSQLKDVHGTTIQLARDTRDAYASLSKLVGVGATTKYAAKMQEFGMGAKTAAAWMGRGVVQAKTLGLDTEKFVDNMTQAVEVTRRMNFQNGINGLQKMVGLATRLGTSVSTLVKHIDVDSGAFSDIEKSINAAASIQKLGGNFAMNFANPMEVMAEGMFDAEASAKRLINTLDGLATFDKTTGQSKISWFENKRIAAFAQATGHDANELRKMAQRQAMGKEIEAQMRSSNAQFSLFSEEQLDAIKNLAEFDPDSGKFHITYTDEDGEQQTKNLEDLTTSQLTKITNLTKNEENINRNVNIIAGNVKSIAAIMKDSAVSTRSAREKISGAEETLGSTKTHVFGLPKVAHWLGDAWNTILKKITFHADGGVVEPSVTKLEGVPSLPKFNSGGLATKILGEEPQIIPGTSTQGDKVLTRVNSGEMILNKKQQTILFNILDGKPQPQKFENGGIVGIDSIPKFEDGGIISDDALQYALYSYLGSKALKNGWLDSRIGIRKGTSARKLNQVKRMSLDYVKGSLTGNMSYLTNGNYTNRLTRRMLRNYLGDFGRNTANLLEKVSIGGSAISNKLGKYSGYNWTANKVGKAYNWTKLGLKEEGRVFREGLSSLGRVFKRNGADIARESTSFSNSLKSITSSTKNVSQNLREASTEIARTTSSVQARKPLTTTALVRASATPTALTPTVAQNSVTALTRTSTPTTALSSTRTTTSTSMPRTPLATRGARVGSRVAGRAGMVLMAAQLANGLIGSKDENSTVNQVLNNRATSAAATGLMMASSIGTQGSIKSLSNIKNIGAAAQNLRTASGAANVAKNVGKSIGKKNALLAAGFAAFDVYNSVSDFNKQKDAIDNDTELTNKQKKDLLRESEDQRNEAIGGAIGGGAGALIGGTLGSMLGPIGTVVGSMAGQWLGEKVGNFVGKGYNTAKDFLFGKEVNLSEEEQAQQDYEEFKMGQVSIEDPMLMEKAATATVAMHDLLISIWHHMNGRASNGEEQNEGALSGVVKTGLSLISTPFAAIGSLFGGKKSPKAKSETDNTLLGHVSQINANVQTFVDNYDTIREESKNNQSLGDNTTNNIITQSLLGFTNGPITPLLKIRNRRTEEFANNSFIEENEDERFANIEKVIDYNNTISVTPNTAITSVDKNTRIEPTPLGEKAVNVSPTVTRNEEVKNSTFNGTQNINLNVGGTIKLDAGNGQIGDLDFKKLFESPLFKQKIMDVVLNGINVTSGNGRILKDSVQAQRGMFNGQNH